jgi:HPt (histidine-containing phosphotransfer) domain-containing protein
MDAYVTKPIDTQRLFPVLAQWTRRPDDTSGTGDPSALKASVRPPSRHPIGLLELPGIDMKEALTRLGDDSALLADLLVEFKQKFSASASEIGNAVRAGDQQGALDLVHSLKGAAANLAAKEIKQIAETLEKAIKSEDQRSYLAQLGPLDKAMQALHGPLTACAANPIAAEATAGVGQPDRDLGRHIHKLNRLLAEDNLEAGSQWQRLRRHLDRDRFKVQIERLDIYLGQLDFAQAREPLAQIAKAYA